MKYHHRFVISSPTHSVHHTKKYLHISIKQMLQKKPFKPPMTIFSGLVSTYSNFPKHQWDNFVHKQNSCLIYSHQDLPQNISLHINIWWSELQYCPSRASRMESPLLGWPNRMPNMDTTWHRGVLCAPAPGNCHCYEFYFPTTECTPISNTIVFYPPDTYQQVTLPTPEEMRMKAAK